MSAAMRGNDGGLAKYSVSTLRGSDRVTRSIYLKLNNEVGMRLIGFKEICQKDLSGLTEKRCLKKYACN